MVALLLSLSLTGCLSTVRIKRAPLSKTEIDAQNKQTKVEGIPFYIKVAKCKQETSWLQPVYTLILKKTVSQKFVDQDAADTAAEACKKEKLQNPKASCKDKPKLDENVSTRTQVLSLSQFQGTP